MTLVPPANTRTDHPGELRLRRHRIGELGGADAQTMERHLADCADCRTRLDTLEDEQRAFAAQIPFDRFAGGVERAARVPRPRPVSRRSIIAGSGLALAAAAALVLVIRPGSGDPAGTNRIKGGGDTEARLQIALAAGGQRALEPGGRTQLKPGDRLRLGYRTARSGDVVALTVDDDGGVSPLLPDRALAVPVSPASGFTYLPEAFELTGEGKERIYMIVGPGPFGRADDVLRAVTAAYLRARGNIAVMGPLDFGWPVDATTFTWLLDKP